MKKKALLPALLIFTIFPVCASDLRKKAGLSPLDCALYFLSKGKNAIDAEILARTFFEVGQYDNALRTIDFENNSYSKFRWFAFYGNQLIEQNKFKEANIFLTKAFAILRDEEWLHEDSLTIFVSNLVKLNRSNEAFEIIKHQEYEDDKAQLLISVAGTLIKTEQSEKAKNVLQDALKLSVKFKDFEKLLRISALYAQLKQTDKSREILKLIDSSAFSGETEIEANNNRRKILFPFLNVYLELGETEKAFELWNQYGDQESFYEFSAFADNLIAYGQKENALALLLQMQSDKEQMRHEGSRIVESYLKLGDVETAIAIAKTMADEFDNYSQQESFIKLADRFISEGKNDSALNILDFAFQRAKKISNEHHPMASVGASSGSRKKIYLGQIYKRLMKLKQFDKAFMVFNAIDSDHSLAKQFVAEHLVDFAKQQIKTLPRKKTYEFLTQAQNIVKDEEYYSMQAKLLSAEVYVQIGERDKAVKLIAEILAEAKESCCYDDDFLILTGKVFEENKLKADVNLKKILRQYIADAGN